MPLHFFIFVYSFSSTISILRLAFYFPVSYLFFVLHFLFYFVYFYFMHHIYFMSCILFLFLFLFSCNLMLASLDFAFNHSISLLIFFFADDNCEWLSIILLNSCSVDAVLFYLIMSLLVLHFSHDYNL